MVLEYCGFEPLAAALSIVCCICDLIKSCTHSGRDKHQSGTTKHTYEQHSNHTDEHNSNHIDEARTKHTVEQDTQNPLTQQVNSHGADLRTLH